MARNISVVVMNMLKRLVRMFGIHISVLMITLLSLPLARKIIFGLVALAFVVSFLRGLNPELSTSFQKIILGSRMVI